MTHAFEDSAVEKTISHLEQLKNRVFDFLQHMHHDLKESIKQNQIISQERKQIYLKIAENWKKMQGMLIAVIV